VYLLASAFAFFLPSDLMESVCSVRCDTRRSYRRRAGQACVFWACLCLGVCLLVRGRGPVWSVSACVLSPQRWSEGACGGSIPACGSHSSGQMCRLLHEVAHQRTTSTTTTYINHLPEGSFPKFLKLYSCSSNQILSNINHIKIVECFPLSRP
jgi:hypothetical protein